MAENTDKNKDPENNNDGADAGSSQHQGLSLGALLNDSIQDGEVFDALAFLDSKPKKEKKSHPDEKKHHKQEGDKTSISDPGSEHNPGVMDSLMEAAAITAAEEKTGKKEEKHEFLYKPASPKPAGQGQELPKENKTASAAGLKNASEAGKVQPKQQNPFKVPVPPSEAAKKTVQITTAFEFEPGHENAGSSASQDVNNSKQGGEKSKSGADGAAEKTQKTSGKDKTARKKAGSRKKLAAAFLVLLCASAAVLMLGRNGAKNNVPDPGSLAINKDVPSDAGETDYSENISDWIPQNPAENLPDTQPIWSADDSGPATDSRYSLGLEGQQGTSWKSDVFNSSSSPDELPDFSDFGGTSWRSSDYGGSSGSSSDYYSSMNFSFGGGMSWSGGGGTSMTSGGGSSGGSYSASSSDDSGDLSLSEAAGSSAPSQAAVKGKYKGRAVSGPDTSYSSGGNGGSSDFSYKMQQANSAFGTSSDIANANYGSSFDRGGRGEGGEGSRAEAFSGGGKMNMSGMDGAGRGGLNMDAVKNAAGASSGGAPAVSDSVDATGESSGSPVSSVGGDNPASSISANNTAFEHNPSTSTVKTDTDTAKTDTEEDAEGNNGNGVHVSTPVPVSQGAKKCPGDLSNFHPGQSGQLQEPYKGRFLSGSRTYCGNGCGGKYYSYTDNSLGFYITYDCQFQVIITGQQEETDFKSGNKTIKKYTDTYLVSDPKTGSDIQRIDLVIDD